MAGFPGGGQTRRKNPLIFSSFRNLSDSNPSLLSNSLIPLPFGPPFRLSPIAIFPDCWIPVYPSKEKWSLLIFSVYRKLRSQKNLPVPYFHWRHRLIYSSAAPS